MATLSFDRILREHAFFTGLSEAHLATLAGCAANVVFDAGRFLFRSGEAAERFFLVRQGTVAVEILPPGRGPVTIETISSGEVVGWSWLFPPFKWHFDTRAVTSVRALALDGACLRAKCEEDPRLGFELMKRFAQVVVKRLESTQIQLLDIHGGSSRG